MEIGNAYCIHNIVGKDLSMIGPLIHNIECLMIGPLIYMTILHCYKWFFFFCFMFFDWDVLLTQLQ